MCFLLELESGVNWVALPLTPPSGGKIFPNTYSLQWLCYGLVTFMCPSHILACSNMLAGSKQWCICKFFKRLQLSMLKVQLAVSECVRSTIGV